MCFYTPEPTAKGFLNGEKMFEHSQQYTRNRTLENGWVLHSVVNTEAYYSPEATHSAYADSYEFPVFTLGEAAYRIHRLEEAGYRATGSMALVAAEVSVPAAIKMHANVPYHLEKGHLFGPVIMDRSVYRGFRFYEKWS